MFNASIIITDLLGKTLENCAKELATRCIKEIALRHDFDADEEIRLLGLENLNLIRKQMAKKSGSKKEKAVKGAPKEKKSSFPLPFEASNINKSGCQGLAFNRGLFTQCSKKCMENGSFCNGCQNEADKNASGSPDCGTVSSRLTSGLYDFKDPNGRKPVSYSKVLQKLKLTIADALEEAGKKNIELSDEHFDVGAAKKKGKGRPKKIAKEVKMDNVADLFANLTADVEENITDLMEEEEDTISKTSKSSKKSLTDAEKAVKKAELEAKRAEKKQERENKMAEEKAEKAEKAEKIAQEKSEKAAVIAQEKAEKAAAIAQEKAQKAAAIAQEKTAKIAQEKAEREAKRKAEKELAEQKKKENKPSSKASTKSVEVAPQEPVATKVTVSRILIEGKMYLKTSNNVLYNLEKEEVGTYDPETKTIKPLPDEDEEEEEEYDE
jgi:hypothetical protein